MIEILPNWHPIFVHFTVALFTTAVFLFLLGSVLKQGPIKTQMLNVAYWNLWIGGVLTVVTLLMGWLAYNSVAHDTPSHNQMTIHRNWAFAAAGLFAVLIAWSIVIKLKSARPNMLFILVALVAQSLLGITAYHGGEAVYRFGLGVKSLPKVEGKGHAHKHADGQDHNGKSKGQSKGDVGDKSNAHAPEKKSGHPSLDAPLEKQKVPAQPATDGHSHSHSSPKPATNSPTKKHSDTEHVH